MLSANAAPRAWIVTGARVLDSVNGVDALIDVRIDDGVIAQLGTPLERNGHRGRGRGPRARARVRRPARAPASRPRGRGDDRERDRRRRAAGGYCAISAMPNTEPVVDSAAVLGALFEDARREAEVPSASWRRSRRPAGGELTEMAELADAGAVAFTDDGRPVVRA